MYKTRIHQWGLDRKLKEHEARAIIHMYSRRRGKATRMRLRDLPVGIEKAYSHFQRKKITIDSVLAYDAVWLPDLVCETPAASPAPMSQDLVSMVPADSIIPELQNLMTMAGPQDLGSPGAFRVGEMLFIDAREYINGSIHLGYSLNLSRKSLCSFKALYTVYPGMKDSCSRLDQPQEVRDLVAKEYSNLDKIAEDTSYGVVLMMICTIATLLGRQQKQKLGASMLCKKLYFIAINSKSRQDPIISVFGRFFSNLDLLLHTDDAADYLLATIHVFIDSLKMILGPVHLRTLNAVVVLSEVTNILYGPEGLLKPLETLRSSLEEQSGWSMKHSAMIMMEIIELNIECGHYQTAQNIVREFKKFAILQDIKNDWLIKWHEERAAYLKAVMRRQHGDGRPGPNDQHDIWGSIDLSEEKNLGNQRVFRTW